MSGGYWQLWRGNITIWDSREVYEDGNVVIRAGNNTAIYYVSLGFNQDDGPPSPSWAQLHDRPPVNMGYYSATTTYSAGDYVQVRGDGNTVTGCGSVFVQKYDAADFLLLGVPT